MEMLRRAARSALSHRLCFEPKSRKVVILSRGKFWGFHKIGRGHWLLTFHYLSLQQGSRDSIAFFMP